MHSLNKYLIGIVLVFTFGCKKEKISNFGVSDVYVLDEKARKNKNKSEAEFISILYTNLYQLPISPNQLFKTQNVLLSIGDRNVANEMLLSNYFNTGTLNIPTNANMRGNIDSFITLTYKKFYLRFPSEAEKTFFNKYITSNNAVTVEMVYTSMATSNEYQYY